MIKPAMWQVIDGDTLLCEVDQITQLLPTPLRVMTRNEALVIIAYEDWKQRVLRVQAKRGENRHE